MSDSTLPSPQPATEADGHPSGSGLEASLGLLGRARAIFRLSDKPDDFAWARWGTRPYAALILAAIHKRAITPNAISVVSLFLGLASCAAYGFWQGYVGLWMAWLLGQASYTVDCMDGMQARYKGLFSPSGTSMDFLVDAIKQIFLFPAVGYRLWVESGRPLELIDGWPLWTALLVGPVVAAGLATTVFLRSSEVTGEVEREHRQAHDVSLAGRVMAAVAFLMNYPSWILIPVIFDRMDVFLLISAPLYGLYAVYSWLLVWKRVCGLDHYERVARRG
ncbi:MAG: phosphatidylglycerophosphate synthase [Pseudohongiellaceae bacterium]|jgi:phosphatidylglycerophosphate synthase